MWGWGCRILNDTVASPDRLSLSLLQIAVYYRIIVFARADWYMADVEYYRFLKVQHYWSDHGKRNQVGRNSVTRHMLTACPQTSLRKYTVRFSAIWLAIEKLKMTNGMPTLAWAVPRSKLGLMSLHRGLYHADIQTIFFMIQVTMIYGLWCNQHIGHTETGSRFKASSKRPRIGDRSCYS